MYKSLIIAALILSACSTKDEQFCECLKAGDELNKVTAKFMSEIPTDKDAKKIQELKKEKNEACKNYIEMSGEEMRKRKTDCEE
ncbi:MAG: hypothetical protein A3D92_04195 [Bacteroidetes bacterium RIFCSPHIGHO2_02_FULL_44_7]|nr:MAG: hypothetical protein A3D92_04195 [Bacteroidetes bacterium RIFCSPHIGHO2_02_FULL_44_7]